MSDTYSKRRPTFFEWLFRKEVILTPKVKKEIYKEANETWTHRKYYAGIEINCFPYGRHVVYYKYTDLETGSQWIEKEYLDDCEG